MKWTNKPITWGAYILMCVISFIIGLIGSGVYLIEMFGFDQVKHCFIRNKTENKTEF